MCPDGGLESADGPIFIKIPLNRLNTPPLHDFLFFAMKSTLNIFQVVLNEAMRPVSVTEVMRGGFQGVRENPGPGRRLNLHKYRNSKK